MKDQLLSPVSSPTQKVYAPNGALPLSYRQKTIEGAFSDAIPKNGPINWGAQNHQIGKLIMDSQEAKQKMELVMQLNLSNNMIAPLNLKKGTEAWARSFESSGKREEGLIQKLQNEKGAPPGVQPPRAQSLMNKKDRDFIQQGATTHSNNFTNERYNQD